jgi:hypothetical protein
LLIFDDGFLLLFEIDEFAFDYHRDVVDFFVVLILYLIVDFNDLCIVFWFFLQVFHQLTLLVAGTYLILVIVKSAHNLKLLPFHLDEMVTKSAEFLRLFFMEFQVQLTSFLRLHMKEEYNRMKYKCIRLYSLNLGWKIR